MLRRVFRIGLMLALILLTIQLVQGVLLLFPAPFFRHTYLSSNLHFYSDAPIPASEKHAFDKLALRFSRQAIKAPSINHRIFLSNFQQKYAFYSFLVGKNAGSQGFNVEPTGNIFINKPFIKTIQNRYGVAFKYTILEGDVSHIVAHEIAHTIATKKMGYWRSRALPSWKREGFAEYLAAEVRKDANAVLVKMVDQFQSLTVDTVSPVRLHYLKSQLLIRYLIEIEGMDFDAIMSSDLQEDEIFSQLMAWYALQGLLSSCDCSTIIHSHMTFNPRYDE